MAIKALGPDGLEAGRILQRGSADLLPNLRREGIQTGNLFGSSEKETNTTEITGDEDVC